MSTTSFRARWLAPALPLALMACSPPSAQSRMEARQAALDPPALWRVEALGAGGAALYVCADRGLREGFLRAQAEAGGRLCRPLRGAVERDGLYAHRCDLDGRRFGLTVTRSGDPERAFSLAFALRALDGSDDVARQVRRFRRIGACPRGWRIGDQARPGARPSSNAIDAAGSGE